ncbi:MAG: HPr(Ser) kinase/phosphatase [Kiritimatiellae bacterium]|nr:HPr(Ser) kinase/phosphatase [Kiritimatiellia bacterium]
MEELPTSKAVKGVPVTVTDFIEAGAERLGLRLLAGASRAGKVIREPVVNRCGLALTGFFENFAASRVQIVGNAEAAYLRSLSELEREKRFRALARRRAWLFVFTAGRVPGDRLLRLAEEIGAVVLATDVPTRIFGRIATFILETLAAPRTSLYGTMVEVGGLGVLFEGDPGLGKSETALGLIKRGASLVADDLTCIRKDVASNLLFGSASEATAGYMEIRGIGILDVAGVFGVNAIRGEKRLGLVITFRKLDEIRGEVDRIGQTRRTRKILGVDVPNIIIPVSEGRDLVNLVETAAQQQKLVAAGYDPVAVLSARLKRRAVKPHSEKIRKGRTHGR